VERGNVQEMFAKLEFTFACPFLVLLSALSTGEARVVKERLARVGESGRRMAGL
jgi:hypothetical protein